MSRVTVSQVAQAAGLSQPTVSQILSGKGQRYHPDTRQKVHDTARQLGYRVNTAARSMRTGRFDAIALVLGVRGFCSSLPPELLGGIHDATGPAQLNLIVARFNDEQLTDSDHTPHLLATLSADGLLMNYTHAVPDRVHDLLGESGLPAVWINTDRPTCCVRPDDQQAGVAATQQLLERGHRRIAYIDFTPDVGPMGHHYSVAARAAGYAAAMRDAGATATRYNHDTWDGGSPDLFVQQLLSRPDRPTAFVGYGERSIHAIHLAARGLGLAVPDDLSLIKFSSRRDGYSSMLIPEQQVGRRAVQMLQVMIDDPSVKPDAVAIPFDFDAGKTIGPPPET
jgi:LacI family transcriptional regulator